MSNVHNVRGVRKVNEKIVEQGRTLIITDKSIADEGHLQHGSLYINPNTGEMEVWLVGDIWMPVQLGSGGGSSIWDSYNNIPLGNMSLQDVEYYIDIFANEIMELQRMIASTWTYPVTSNYSAAIRTARLQIIDVLDTISPGAGTDTANANAVNAYQALVIIRDAIILAYSLLANVDYDLIEVVDGGSSQQGIALLRSEIKELIDVIEDDNDYTNDTSNLVQLAGDLNSVIDVLFDESLDRLQMSSLQTMSNTDVLNLLTDTLEEVKNVIYTE